MATKPIGTDCGTVTTNDPVATKGHFRDEHGNPSDRFGPDLNAAPPIEMVIKRLSRLRKNYAVEFWKACQASGIDVSVTRNVNGEDRLGLGFPFDS